jgi:hypothetical protein
MSSFPVPVPPPISATPVPDAVVPHIDPIGGPKDYNFGTELPTIESPTITPLSFGYLIAITINIPSNTSSLVCDIGDFGYILTLDGSAIDFSLLPGPADSTTGKVRTATLTAIRPSGPAPQPISLGVTILCRKKVKPSGPNPPPTIA